MIMSLTKILKKYEQHDDVQLNIHLRLPKNITDYCLHTNESITNNKNEPSLMLFDNSNLSYPHITLSTGFAKDLKNITQIIDIVEEFSLNTQKFSLSFDRLFFSSKYKGAKEYLFLTFNEENFLQSLKETLSIQLQNTYSSNVSWDFLGATPHITLAVFQTDFILPKEIINQIPTCISIERIGVSISGNYGTCIGTLKEFYLQ